jgi:protein-S-isoprenylcysteine O-methyltransferase Ste14
MPRPGERPSADERRGRSGRYGRRVRNRRALAAAGTVAFAAAVPGTVVVVIPHRLAEGRMHPPLAGLRATRWVGAALVAAGTPLVTGAFLRFVRAAGTPAPVFETEDLVAEGVYRCTRNPQYVGVVTVLVGEGLLIGSRRVLAYAAAAAVGFHLFVVGYEEPRLRRRFGERYDRYRRATPRWLPLGLLSRWSRTPVPGGGAAGRGAAADRPRGRARWRGRRPAPQAPR